MIRYTAVSVISTVMSFIVLTIVFGVFRLWSEVPSVLFANVVAGICSYQLNRRWVWGKTGRSHVSKELLPFWTMSLAGMVFSLVAAAQAHAFAISHHLAHIPRTALLLTANVGAWGSLWLIKFFLFNRIFRQSPEPRPTELAEAGAPIR